MDRLDALHAFVLSVDRGSLSGAARALQRSSASITRAIDALEERVGAPLLRRTTRSIKLTEAGERYLVVARRVLADLDQAERDAHAHGAEPHGVLAVTAPVAFGGLHVAPQVDDYLSANPGVSVRLLLVDRIVSLAEEGVDVAVRIGKLPDSALVAIRVGEVRRLTVASPGYLAAHGRPRTPRDLARHHCIAATPVTPHDTWSFGRRGGRPLRVRIAPRLTANVADAAIRSALRGAGITCAISYQVAEHLERGALVRVLGSYEPAPVPAHVVHLPGSDRTPKVRAFVDLVSTRLRNLLR